jgi:hypothetical protein
MLYAASQVFDLRRDGVMSVGSRVEVTFMVRWYIGGYGTQVTSHEPRGIGKENFLLFLNRPELQDYLMHIYIHTKEWCNFKS